MDTIEVSQRHAACVDCSEDIPRPAPLFAPAALPVTPVMPSPQQLIQPAPTPAQTSSMTAVINHNDLHDLVIVRPSSSAPFGFAVASLWTIDGR